MVLPCFFLIISFVHARDAFLLRFTAEGRCQHGNRGDPGWVPLSLFEVPSMAEMNYRVGTLHQNIRLITLSQPDWVASIAEYVASPSDTHFEIEITAWLVLVALAITDDPVFRARKSIIKQCCRPVYDFQIDVGWPRRLPLVTTADHR
ncbi:uncharacterized protein L969DRAFT_88118 [Mixia osmundae IAM 14324]|uniref:uncharacterized protein n=1 Tax=Mixia osmundae (strain CBS 9802 / IAM 14324 / JCM 22182 / KY 12970) TaxID=764103 RepID=UPI0004A54C7E|nr:uncharacterized protein L969DRAFT_88118 [Mixia osmundae IAM 14324]KEI38796.1 hypothetical protein L969DRAFT_88118 [Mixia osmundae IAM 14324]